MPTIDFAGAPLYAFLFSLAASPSSVGQSLLVEGNGRHHVFVSPNGEFRFFLGSTTNPSFLLSGNGKVGAGPTLALIYLDADGKHHMRINGADFVNGAINFTTSAASGGRLGQYTNGTDPMVDGAIAAMVFAGDVQTLTDIQKLEGYLAQRFVGTTFLPVGHPYRSTAPRKLS